MRSEQSDPTLYVSCVKQYAPLLQEKKTGVVYIGKTFVYGLLGGVDLMDTDSFILKAKELTEKEPKVVKKDNITWKFADKKKKPIKVTKIMEFMMTSGSGFAQEKMIEALKELGAHEGDEE
jgi:hypothetical protein